MASLLAASCARPWSSSALRPAKTSILPPALSVRHVSSSPYGRTHVWKRRPARLPNPVVPQFPQRVVRADGSSFTHWTTSPRASLKLTRDVSNHPVWNPAEALAGERDEDGKTAGRLGRFARRFGGEMGLSQEEDMSWVAEYATETGVAPKGKATATAPESSGKKKKR
jgi:ribosomal protein L31